MYIVNVGDQETQNIREKNSFNQRKYPMNIFKLLDFWSKRFVTRTLPSGLYGEYFWEGVKKTKNLKKATSFKHSLTSKAAKCPPPARPAPASSTSSRTRRSRPVGFFLTNRDEGPSFQRERESGLSTFSEFFFLTLLPLPAGALPLSLLFCFAPSLSPASFSSKYEKKRKIRDVLLRKGRARG